MLPFMNPTKKKSKKYVVAFKGLNYGEGYEDGEFSDAKNISLDEFPCLTQRSGRFEDPLLELTEASSIYVKDEPYIVDGTNLVIGGRVDVSVVEGLFKKSGAKQIVCVGDCLVFFPDKVYYNVETHEHGDMDVTFKGVARITNSTIEIDDGIFPFSKGDSVEISGSAKGNNKSAIVRGFAEKVLTFDTNTFDDEEAEITISRTVPELDYICESNYRLWGVKGNTIYGSKYMDPLNFQSFDGSSGDSYAIDVGTDGKFTGCIAYNSHICFFKENVLHKLFGSKPSNFQLVTSKVNGLERGSYRSLCIINDVLYYKGRDGVYAYTGGTPYLVSEKFGVRKFHSAVATSDGRKYYIAMGTEGEQQTQVLLVYDTINRLWTKEDEVPWGAVGRHYYDISFYNGEVVLLSMDKLQYVTRGREYDTTASGDDILIEWSVTFCPFDEVMNERKGYSKFYLRLDLEQDSKLCVEYKRNTDTEWKEAYCTAGSVGRTLSIPIIPARSDSVEIRLSGVGTCKLRTFIREFYVGSDV